MIAHRLSTIKDADKIVVMMGGEIREVGKHEELISLNGIYSDLILAQSINTNMGSFLLYTSKRIFSSFLVSDVLIFVF